MGTNIFDEAAASWDDKPRRVALMKGIGAAILWEAMPDGQMDLLDYGCGTGLVGLYLLPHVKSVTGADNSAGMLEVLRQKISEGGLEGMKAVRLDLEHEPAPQERYHMITVGMAMHHISDVGRVLGAFREMLVPGGALCIADLDSESGSFHGPGAEGVYHLGFDREEFREKLVESGFSDARFSTVVEFNKPVEGGGEERFSIFLAVAQ